MAKAPTTYEDLRKAVSTDREALTLAAVLPNLYENECVIGIRGWKAANGREYFETDAATLAEFRRRERPIVPGSDLYRAQIVTYADDNSKQADYKGVLPIPHGFKCYDIDRRDLVEFVRVDPEDAEYDDTDQSTLDDYGFGNPYYNPWEANRDAFGRDPKLPV